MLREVSEFRLFRDFSVEDLNTIAPYFSAHTFPAGTIIFEQGEPAISLFLILSGEVAFRYKPYDGPAMDMSRIQEGSVAGWSAVLGNTSYTATAVCNTEVDVLKMEGSDLRLLVAVHPQTGRLLVDRLAVAVTPRWRDAHSQVKALLEKSVTLDPAPFDFKQEGGRKMNKKPIITSREEQLKALIDQLSAYIETYHGGSVEFVDLDDNTLTVHLGGACLGCPLSPATLHGWVEGTVRQFFPDITHLKSV
jgi:CRP-like cAMP-binding protein